MTEIAAHLPRSATGTFEARSGIDGQERLLAYRTLSIYPEFVIAVGQTVDRALSAWRRSAAITSGAWVVSSTVLLLAALWLRREWTRRWQVQSALSLVADRLQAVMDYSVDGVVTISQHGTILSFSRPAQQIFGYDEAELIGQNVRVLMPEPYRSQHDGYVAAYVQTGAAKIIGIGREVRGLRKDGTTFPMDLAVGEIPTSGTERQFVGTVRDVSARKDAEERLKAAEQREAQERDVAAQRLEAAQRRTQRIFETSVDLIMVLDEAARIVQVSPSVERILGRAPDEIVGRPLVSFIQEINSQSVPDEIHHLRSGATAQEFEVRLLHQDGRHVELAWSGVWSGDDRQFFMIGRDMTGARAIEEQLHQSQKMKAIGQLTGGIAHDFNNMLTVIMGNAEALLARDRDDGPLRRSCEMILRAAEGSAELTNRLLAFARKQSLQPKQLSINPFVERIGELLRRTLGENVEIKLSLLSEIWEAMVDPSQLETALLNLGINARDAMPKGGLLTIETANVSIDAAYASANQDAHVGDFVMVAVSDNGSGMAPEVVKRSFEPFFTTKEVGKGTGLGLSMVYGFVRQSGGHVKIYSELHHGTSVKLYLPRAKGALTNADSQGEPELVEPGNGERILVVEDEKLVRELVEMRLRSLGYDVVIAENGNRALDVLSGGERFDLLFTDVVMPGGMSGRELADKVRIMFPNLRILFTSAYTRDAIAHYGRLDAGVILLGKPYRLKDMASKLRDALEGRT